MELTKLSHLVVCPSGLAACLQKVTHAETIEYSIFKICHKMQVLQLPLHRVIIVL